MVLNSSDIKITGSLRKHVRCTTLVNQKYKCLNVKRNKFPVPVYALKNLSVKEEEAVREFGAEGEIWG